MNKPVHLGFPAPLLGREPARLQVVHDDGDLVALAKPVGVLVHADPWYPRLPVLVEAVRYQARQNRPEWIRLNIGEEGLWSVTDLDPECHGPVVFCRRKDTSERLRNAFGANAFLFNYMILSTAAPKETDLLCELPLARHTSQARMLVSHTSGKKCSTRFACMGTFGAYSLWLAQTSFPRRHQILLHAVESGIPVLGDRLYAGSPLPLLSRLKRDYRLRGDQEELPLFEGPACYLERVDLGGGALLCSPAPPRWNGLVNQLRKYSRL